MHPRRAWAFALAACLPLSTHAFTLQWPVACTDGTDCFVQNYVDHGQKPAFQDFTCANLTYPGHDGTDIRLKSLSAMRDGVAVLAPADGTVLRLRDGVPDRSIRDASGDITAGMAAIKGQDCGNGMIIQHADGYETALCHMREGSIRVKAGQPLKAGDPIGLVGLSGNTEFPHLHVTLRHNTQVIDPYTAASPTAACGNAGTPLWATPHPYHATALLNDGFAASVPDKTALRDTPTNLTTIDATAPALTYWVDIMGIHTGDTLTLRLTAPNGSVVAESRTLMPKPSAQYFMYIGKRNAGLLPAGHYVATMALARPGVPHPILSSTRDLEIK